MPLPIPDIMENASKALKAAKMVCEFLESTGEMTPTADIFISLRDALKKVSPDDLLAVLNEVGKVYLGVHNIQVVQIGSRPNPGNKTLEIAIIIEFGLGPRTLITPLPHQVASDFLKGSMENLAIATGTTKTGLITDASQAHGQP